jgi:branched-chain amino acid transport system permease protein
VILFVASLISGITLGGTYVLIGLGLVLVFRATTTFNFAHGQFTLLPAFIIGSSQAKHIPLAVSLPLALVVSAAVGAMSYLFVLRRTTGLPPFMGIIATFGLAAILDGVMGDIFRSNQYAITLPGIPTGQTHIAGASVSEQSLTLAAISLGLGLIIAGLVRFTHLGIMIRAAGQNAVLASQCGIPVRRLYLGSWAAAAVLAAIAGITYGSGAVVSPDMTSLGLAAIPAIVLGGMDSIGGAIVGGEIVGLVQGFSQTYLGGQYVDIVTYSLLLIVLLFYPQGLFGTKNVVRA